MNVVAFGEVMMRMMVVDHKRLTQSDTLEYMFTGTGVNVLSGLHLMEETCYLCSVLPDNAVGHAAAAHIRKLGIHDDHLRFQGDHIGVYFLEKGFGPRSDKVTYLNRSESSFGKARLEDMDPERILDGMDMLHICGIALAINDATRTMALQLARIAKEKGICVVFDCNYRPSLWKDHKEGLAKEVYSEMLSLSDIVFAGEKDAVLMFEITSEQEKGSIAYIEDVLSSFRKKFSIQTIVGTLRDAQQETLQGYVLQEDGFYLSRQHPLHIYDRIGGGDAFAAGYLHAQHCMPSVAQQIEFATCSGVLAHTTYGDSPVCTKEEILSYMEHGKQDIQR